MIQLSEYEWKILNNLWFISSKMDGLKKKICHLPHLKGRDVPGANKLSLRHVQKSLRGGQSLGVKIKSISHMVMASRSLERSR